VPGSVLTGAALARRDGAVASLRGLFAAEGYAAVEPRHLLDADVMLDLYGEDVRTRAFLFPEPVRGGELCLRPDFTVPVAIAHGEGGWERRAAYAYAGPVFRLQDRAETRPIEYLQAGIERYGDENRAAADAGVLALVLQGLDLLGAAPRRVSTGDPGIVFALIDALGMSARRKAALRRHFWRPQRFRALVERFSRPAPEPSARRAALLEAIGEGPAAVEALATDGREAIGARGLDEVVARAAALARAAGEPPLPAETAALLEAVLAVHGRAGEALSRLRALTAEAEVDIADALERFEMRLDALNRVGIDAEELPFDAGFGRNMEYYDGFVFEIAAEGRDDLPPLAGGGRYDRMTRRLGAARPVPAVGAMIRPEAALAAGAGP
jgi:ATP phosphoribosyltransferase regulatory subunit